MDPKKSFLLRYTALPFAIDYLATKELVLPSPATWDDRNDSYYIDQFAARNGLSTTYALCLTEAAETYHHWKVFSSGVSGVCLVFDKDKLLKAVQKEPGLRAEPVTYRLINELRKRPPEDEQLPFLKRYPFRDEMEFRLFIAPTRPPKGVYRIQVPLAAVDRVTLSPWLTPSVADHVKATLKRIPGCKRLRVYRSTLIENERWKQYGTKGG